MLEMINGHENGTTTLDWQITAYYINRSISLKSRNVL